MLRLPRRPEVSFRFWANGSLQALTHHTKWCKGGEGLSRSRGTGVLGFLGALGLAVEFLEFDFLSKDWGTAHSSSSQI